jgi:hypothetical protein
VDLEVDRVTFADPHGESSESKLRRQVVLTNFVRILVRAGRSVRERFDMAQITSSRALALSRSISTSRPKQIVPGLSIYQEKDAQP